MHWTRDTEREPEPILFRRSGATARAEQNFRCGKNLEPEPIAGADELSHFPGFEEALVPEEPLGHTEPEAESEPVYFSGAGVKKLPALHTRKHFAPIITKTDIIINAIAH